MQKKIDVKFDGLIQYFNKENDLIQYNLNSNKYNLNFEMIEKVIDEVKLEKDKLINYFELYGEWYIKNHDRIKAIKCYYNSDNIVKALEIIENIRIEEFVKIESDLLIGIMEKITIEQKKAFKYSCLKIILVYINNVNLSKGKEILKEGKEFYKSINDFEMLNEICIIESLLDFDLLYKNNRQAFKRLEVSKIIDAKTLCMQGINDMIYFIFNNEGHFYEQYKESIEIFADVNKTCNDGMYGSEYLIESQYCAEIGEFEKAEVLAYKAVYKAKIKNAIGIEIGAYFILTRIYSIKGEVDKQNNILEIIKNEINCFENRRYKNQIDEIMLYSREKIENSKDISEFNWTNYLVNCLYLIKEKKFIELEINIEELRKYATKISSVLGYIYSEVFNSILYKHFYKDLKKAEDSLKNAVLMAKKDKIVIPFIENYIYIIDLIKKSKNKDEYYSYILTKCNENINIDNKNEKKVELTLREIEVMNLIGKGYKQTEISSELHIALTTVKKHISSVYDKLGVRNKTRAINMLRERFIIE